jgi:hypothetical protein
MNCKKLQKLLSAYMDGELAKFEQDEVFAHLAGCPACQERLDHYKRIEIAYRTLDKPEVPADFLQQVKARIASGTEKPDREPVLGRALWDALFRPAYAKVPLGLAVVAAVIVMAVMLLRPISGPAPVDGGGIIAVRTPRAGEIIKQVGQGNQNQIIIFSSRPEAAAIIAEALAKECLGRVSYSKTADDGKILVLNVEIPQGQLPIFKDKLMAARNTPAEKILPSQEGTKNSGLPPDSDLGLGETFLKGIGGGTPPDQPPQRGSVTIEIEIRPGRLQK